MIITSQVLDHFISILNNHNFEIGTLRILFVLDECSIVKYFEIIIRLFAQLFFKKEECYKVKKFGKQLVLGKREVMYV